MSDDFAADTAARARWALHHNDGHPKGAWSTGEQLAVALVLLDGSHLTVTGYKPAASRTTCPRRDGETQQVLLV